MKTSSGSDFPSDYPDLLEQMGRIICYKLIEQGLPKAQARENAFEITESIRTEIGGVQQYIPRGQRFQLNQRDIQIVQKFNGRNYHELAREFNLSEMQIRNILKRARTLQSQT